MTWKPSLDTLDHELLAAVSRERQAEMIREARLARQLHNPNGKEGKAMLSRKLIVALCVAAPFVWLVIRAVGVAAAATGGGGGGGWVRLAM
jgi:hypothetical protein